MDEYLEQLIQQLDTVEGWLELEEAMMLYRLAMEPGDGKIVELGTYKGRSTIVFAQACRRMRLSKSAFLTVDTFRGSKEQQPGQEYFVPSTLDSNGRVDTYGAFIDNLNRYGLLPFVEVHRGDTSEAAEMNSDPVRLLFVDSDHSYEGVSRDLKAWIPRLSESAIVVLHDIGDWEGPTRAAADLIANGFTRVDQAGTALALKVGPPASAENAYQSSNEGSKNA